MIAWFAETFEKLAAKPTMRRASSFNQMVKCASGTEGYAGQAGKPRRAWAAGRGAADARPILKTITVELVKFEAAIAAMIQATPRFTELAEIIESVPESAAPPLLR